MRRPLLLVAVALASVAVVGCGGDGDGGGRACGPERREALDPSSAQHVLAGGGADLEYRTDPPTSGPHEPGTPLSGVLDEALARPAQVGSLEAGGVLLQHRDLDPDELADLEALAADGVAVVPNPDLPERVVATAWLFKQSCTEVDAEALQGFVDAHLGEGPGSDG